MKKLLFLLSAIAFVACGDKDDDPIVPTDQQVPAPRILKVEIGERPMVVQDSASQNSRSNRTAAATTTETLSSFTLNYMADYHPTIRKNGGVWESVTWPTQGDEKIDFYANTHGTFHYNNGAPYVSFTMDTDAFQQKDFLVATHPKISYSYGQGTVPLTFEHVCAAVQFQICQTKKVTEKGNSFTINSIVLKNVCKTGYYHYSGEWGLGSTENSPNGSDYTDLTLDNGDINLTTDYQLLPCEWLFLIPQPQSGIQLEIKYTVNGGEEKTKLLNIGFESWEKGIQYTFSIRVGSSFLN